MAAVARATPDGTTLIVGHIGTLAVNPGLYAKLPYDPVKSFEPIGLIAKVHNVLGAEPWVSTPEAFRAHILREIAVWGDIIRRVNVPLIGKAD